MSARAGAEMVKAIGFLLRGNRELRIMGASGIAERDICIIEKKGYRNCRERFMHYRVKRKVRMERNIRRVRI